MNEPEPTIEYAWESQWDERLMREHSFLLQAVQPIHCRAFVRVFDRWRVYISGNSLCVQVTIATLDGGRSTATLIPADAVCRYARRLVALFQQGLGCEETLDIAYRGAEPNCVYDD